MAKPKVFVRSAYNYDRREAGRQSALVTPPDEKIRTVQAAKDEVDINQIVQKWMRTGSVELGGRIPSYSDYGSQIFDFQSAMNVVHDARESFLRLPAKLRMRFGHDPQEFLKFCADPENLPEMKKLGLLKPVEDNIPAPPDGGKQQEKSGEQRSVGKKSGPGGQAKGAPGGSARGDESGAGDSDE